MYNKTAIKALEMFLGSFSRKTIENHLKNIKSNVSAYELPYKGNPFIEEALRDGNWYTSNLYLEDWTQSLNLDTYPLHGDGDQKTIVTVLIGSLLSTVTPEEAVESLVHLIGESSICELSRFVKYINEEASFVNKSLLAKIAVDSIYDNINIQDIIRTDTTNKGISANLITLVLLRSKIISVNEEVSNG